MLLCEVDLSKCVTYDWHKSTYTNCCKVQGNHEPEEKGTLSTVHGYRIPAGKIVPVKQTSNMWRHDYNEYVVFDPSLVRIRYVVCLKDASNKEDISKEKILEEINYVEGFLKIVAKKLENERFVANAPVEVVELERKKQADAQAKLGVLQESLARLD